MESSSAVLGLRHCRMFGVPPSRDALAMREAAVLPSI
jgi:hypothetical protein